MKQGKWCYQSGAPVRPVCGPLATCPGPHRPRNIEPNFYYIGKETRCCFGDDPPPPPPVPACLFLFAVWASASLFLWSRVCVRGKATSSGRVKSDREAELLRATIMLKLVLMLMPCHAHGATPVSFFRPTDRLDSPLLGLFHHANSAILRHVCGDRGD